MRQRRGFALLAVLWVLVGASALALGASLAARRAVGTSYNRANITRAGWRAEACLEIARAAIADVLRDPVVSRSGKRLTWMTLDLAVSESTLLRGTDCDLLAEPVGARIDVNSADGEMVRALFAALGVPPTRGDSLADALLDWRDADDDTRPHGAERAWYEAQNAHPPRNSSLAHIRELSRVRGFAELSKVIPLDSVLSVEVGRIVLDRASLVVIAALPGFDEEALGRVSEHRERGASVGELIGFGGSLSPGARASLHARYADLVRLTTAEPDAWILTSRAAAGTPRVAVAAEARLVRAGDRAAMVRRRTWIE